MMMIATAAVVGVITSGIVAADRGLTTTVPRQPMSESPSVSAAGSGRPWRGVALDNTVHERWMNRAFLCVTGKFWGEAGELENSP
jgi:hypothetical protein